MPEEPTSAEESIKILPRKELEHLLSTRYPKAEIVLTDRNYAILDPEWVEKYAFKAYAEWISIFGFKRKIKNSFWKTIGTAMTCLLLLKHI